MDRTNLVRLRWRLTGAWLWPSFVTLTLVDAVVVHWLPPEGDSESAIGAGIISAVLMLLAVGLFSPTFGALIRAWRRDIPRSVARNYGGALAAFGVSGALVLAGVIHHHAIVRDNAALADANARAESWIDDHAPAQFQAHIGTVDTLVIQAPTLYRVCVDGNSADRIYCVVVDDSKPFGTGVWPAGHQSNELLSQGLN